MASDMQDKFRVSCANAQDYPRNLIDIDRSGPSFVTTMEELKREKGSVWDPTTAELMLLELYDGDEGMFSSAPKHRRVDTSADAGAIQSVSGQVSMTKLNSWVTSKGIAKIPASASCTSDSPVSIHLMPRRY